jgi:glutamate racemase
VLKIGVFDSGIGGMKIATSIFDQLTNVKIYYFADQAFSPYGDLSEAEIYRRCEVITSKFIDEGVDLIVVACNTATSVSIERLRDNFSLPFVGVEPDLNYFNRNMIPDSSSVGVLTTPVTMKMEKFNNLREKLDPKNTFEYIPMPRLASLVEELFFCEEEGLNTFKNHIEKDLTNCMSKRLDYLVLGCTHYGLIDQFISDTLGVKTICPSMAVVRQVKSLLGTKLENEKTKLKNNEFYYLSSKIDNDFKKMNLEWKQRFKSEKLMS